MRYSLRKGIEGSEEPLDALMSDTLFLAKKGKILYCKDERGCINFDATDLFNSFIRLCIKDTKKFWENCLSPVVLQWLNTGDESLRQTVHNEVYSVHFRLQDKNRSLLDYTSLHYSLEALYEASSQSFNAQIGWLPWQIAYMVVESTQCAFFYANVPRHITWKKQNKRLKRMISYRLKQLRKEKYETK